MITSNYDFGDITNRMLQRVPSKIDKRQGSLIYNAVAPASLEFAKIYLMLQSIEKEAFPDTASIEYLKRHAKIKNLSLNEATYAIVRGEFNKKIPEGTRFSLQDSELNYIVMSESPKWDGDNARLYYYLMMCETTGSKGNQTGNLIPITDIEGLTVAKIVGIATYGTDTETTEKFRNRYFDTILNPPFGGNRADYKRYIRSINGVGACRLIRTPSGGGTVGVIICDSEYNEPSHELVGSVQTLIDPVVNSGNGFGMAPIGHRVTVSAVETVGIEVISKIEYQEGYTWNDITESYQNTISDYFAELNESWGDIDPDNIVVRMTQIEQRILNLNGVLDVVDIKLYPYGENATTNNFSVPDGKLVSNCSTGWEPLSLNAGVEAKISKDPSGNGNAVKFLCGSDVYGNGWSYDIARLLDKKPTDFIEATGYLTVSFELFQPENSRGLGNFYIDLSGNKIIKNSDGGNTYTYGRLSGYEPNTTEIKIIGGSAKTSDGVDKVHIANEKVLGNWVTVEFKIDFTTRQNFTCIYNNREHIVTGFPSTVDPSSLYLNIQLSDNPQHTNDIETYIKNVSAVYITE